MLTAKEVCDRLSGDNITVGYLDSQTGMQEMTLTEFKAHRDRIPFYRVWYFKDGKTLIWDRTRNFKPPTLLLLFSPTMRISEEPP